MSSEMLVIKNDTFKKLDLNVRAEQEISVIGKPSNLKLCSCIIIVFNG